MPYHAMLVCVALLFLVCAVIHQVLQPLGGGGVGARG